MMEQLLDDSSVTCIRCRQPLQFRLSRFGCVFSCNCGASTVDGQKAVNAYYNKVCCGDTSRLLPYLPRIELSAFSTRGIFTTKHVSIEVVCHHRKVLVRLHHYCLEDAARLMESLSLGVAENAAGLLELQQGGAENDVWEVAFPIEVADELQSELKSLAENSVNSEACFVLSAPPPQLLLSAGNADTTQPTAPASLPFALARVLHQHQRELVEQAVRWRGRILIADEMGVGKTLEALGVVAVHAAYPLLVVSPSALKCMWAEEVEKYLHEQVGVHDIHVIHGSNDALSTDSSSTPKVVITSYHMAAALRHQLQARRWRCLLVDESHMLHTNASGLDATYTSLLVSIGKSSEYCVLLSGTPTLTSPFDMFNQLDTLHPGLLGANRWEFALRYCQISMTPYVHISKCTRPVEFSSALRAFFMVRRLKKDVLDLPRKTRVVLKVTAVGAGDVVTRQSVSSFSDPQDPSFQTRYAQCWQRKRRGIFEVVDFVCQKHFSVVLFAHHLALLNALCGFLAAQKISHIRIDGSVDVHARGGLVGRFDRGEARVAVVGITACAVGISLTTADCAVFCELPPDASWLAQAEDRLHRPGQEREVSIYYLIGSGLRFDAKHFAELCESSERVRRVTDGMTGQALAFEHSSHKDSLSVFRDGTGFPERRHTTKRRESLPTAVAPPRCVPFQFTISRNTHRIHATVALAGGDREGMESAAQTPYVTLSFEEAAMCVRHRSHPVWEQLSVFMSRFELLSPFHQRNFIAAKRWWPSEFSWPANEAPSQDSRRAHTAHGARSRYHKANSFSNNRALGGRSNKSSEDTSPEIPSTAAGWGFWWKVKRPGFVTRHYFAPLVQVRNTDCQTHQTLYRAACLTCGELLSLLPHGDRTQETPATAVPGDVVTVDSDTMMFCCGKCRQDFFIRRSGSAVRRAVGHVDRGVCAFCHVDCGALLSECSTLSSAKARAAAVCRSLPHLEQFPALFRAFVKAPIAGNLWHADHILPVALGGGEATLANLQTLCVACHALKTQEDLKAIQAVRTEAAVRSNNGCPAQLSVSTVDVATQKLLAAKQSHRPCRRG